MRKQLQKGNSVPGIGMSDAFAEAALKLGAVKQAG